MALLLATTIGCTASDGGNSVDSTVKQSPLNNAVDGNQPTQLSSTNLPSSIVFKSIPGGTFTMGDNSINSARKGVTATEHEVTLSSFEVSETEVTTAQFAEFLSNAYKDGLIEIKETGRATEVVGSDSSEYAGKGLYALSGTRVMKDHDNADGDAQGLGGGKGAFTGTIEPENPLNIAFIGFDESREDPFFVKDPHTDFDWHKVCEYYDYTSTPKELDTSSELKNDYANWSELQNLPTLEEVSNYPVAYIRWWGAKAFTLYYDIKLLTEAQWEYAAKGGQNFYYAVHNGTDVSDANWNKEQAGPATHHRHNVKEGTPNPYGLYNLGGNVWEWVEDNYEAYDTASVTDPLILVDGSNDRCKRGGAWNYHQATLKTASRDYTFDNRGNDHHGFRLARAPVTDEQTTDVENQTSDVSAVEFVNVSGDGKSAVEFVDVPGDGKDVEPFKLATTEITNQQYVDFLNAALRENMITVGPAESTNMLIYDKNGNQMMNILGYRVIKDHDRNGVFELWEMENPLNRCMVEYDSEQKMFSVVNPNEANWEIYFDSAVYPNVVDQITNWCEFHEFWSTDGKEAFSKDNYDVVTFSKDIYDNGGNVKNDITFAGHLDLDCQLPSFEEVQRWPVNHVQYYGAKAFADFHGYELPSLQELQWAGKGGHEDWVYATNDGTINSGNVVSNGGWDRRDGKHKGHPQPVATFAPNPYGVYDLSGNVAEWSRTVDTGNLGCRQNPSASRGESTDSMVRIDGAWPRPDMMCEIRNCINTDVTRGNDHFGFRVVK